MTHTHTHIYIYIYVCVCVCIYKIYNHIYCKYIFWQSVPSSFLGCGDLCLCLSDVFIYEEAGTDCQKDIFTIHVITVNNDVVILIM